MNKAYSRLVLSLVLLGTAGDLHAQALQPDTALSGVDASFWGEEAQDRSGWVGPAGDVNGDGYADFLIGAYGNQDGGGSYAGQAYLILGKAGGWAMDTDLSLADASIWGEAAGDYAGYHVSSAGDVNGDGYDEILIGAPKRLGSRGEAYLFLGKPSGWAMDMSLSNADGSFKGENASAEAGRRVGTAGDVNGDGYDDILIAAPYDGEGGTKAGQVYLYLGKASGWVMDEELSTADASFIGEAANDEAGWGAASAGDVNGDGYDDIVIGAFGNQAGGGVDAGQAYLIFGKATGRAMDTALSASDASFWGEAAGDKAGYAATSAGDVNGDGYDDILIGAYVNAEGGANAGQVYLIFGKASGWAMDTDLSAADASFWSAGATYAGYSVAPAGDVDNDGYDDVLIGAPQNTAGETFVVYGKASGWAMDTDLSTAGASFLGESFGEFAGGSVASPGDVNNDGYSDFIIGAWRNGDGGGWAGQSYLVLGSADVPSVTTTAASSITSTTASSGGNVLSQGGAAVTSRGVCWSTSVAPTTADSKTTDGSGTGVFASSITGLSAGTTYYVRAYATNSVGTGYGNEISFTADTIPTVTTTAVSNITTTTADSGGNVTSDGGDTVTARGVCWSTSSSPTIADSKTTNGTGTGVFTSNITGLTPSTTYFIRAYATNSLGTAYGNEVSTAVGLSTALQPDTPLSGVNASFVGEEEQDRSGWVGAAGDVNGDGYDDFLIGAYGNAEGGGANAGQTYLILGKAGGWNMKTDLSLADASFLGETASDFSGYWVSSAGDVNGDGKDDILIGAYADSAGIGTYAGQVYLVFGKASGWAMDTDLSTADASFLAEDAGDQAGRRVASAGDVNNDGYDDILIGAPFDEDGGYRAGQVYLILGKASGWAMDTSLSASDASFWGEDTGDLAGYSVASAGDVNKDTYDDILIGAKFDDDGGVDAGQAYLVLGKASGWAMDTDLSTSDASFWGEYADDQAGFSVASAGDVDGDGYDDILIGAYGNAEGGAADTGQSYLILGKASGWAMDTDLVASDASFWGAAVGGFAGYSVAPAGDLNNDGYADIIIGAPQVAAGETFVVLGKASGWAMDTNLSAADASFEGETAGDFSGCSVSSAGDVNGDGAVDMLIGAWRNSEGGGWAGQTYLVMGVSDVPTVTTEAASSIGSTTTTSGGTVTSQGTAAVSARGVCWSTSTGPTTADSKTTDGTGGGSFASSITGLTASTTYYVRAYATNSVGTSYGNEVSFTTVATPTVTTTAISNITATTADSGGNVTADGGSAVTARGVCWSTSTGPTTADSKTVDGTGLGVFTSNLTGLTGGTTYYVRAYATNTNGTSYGSEVSFTTSATTPTVTTTAISNVTTTTADSGGNVTADGGDAVTARGVCWSTSTSPTTADSKTTDGTGTGVFASSITGLSANTTYYVRAYATNGVGTSYGSEVSFTTDTSPTVTTTALSNIAETTADSGGNVTADGGDAVTARGVCWNTSTGPTTADSKTTDGTGTGVFTSNITGLTGGTTYYVRAYATNSVGTAYGSEVSFTTSSVVPTVTTTAISNVTGTTASSGGNVTVDGGDAVTARGVCWSTSTGPTTADSKTTDGTGTGVFTSSLTGLTANTTYYVRAYATNSVGTSYGSELSFATDAAPTVTTAAISNITATTADAGGDVTADGGEAVTVRGVCWSTSANPTTADSKTTDGTGTGAFTSSITGLTADTTYYVAAYATNSVGTSYGSDVSFTTDAAPTVTTTAISNLTETAADSGGNVTEDLGDAVTARGVCWSTSTAPTIADSKTTDGTGTGAFTSSLTGLTPGATYYLRAYATNGAGTGYGNEVSFTTYNTPTVTTTALSNVTGTTADSGGDVTNDGGDAVTARGVCWSTSASPTTADSKTSDGTGTGVFTSSITGLSGGTTFYVRAYATNSYGTGYGSEVQTTAARWENVGTPGFSASTVSYLSFAIGGGEPYVAYKDPANANEVTVMRYTGGSWQNVGTAGFSDRGNVTSTSIAFEGGEPYVANSDFQANVMRFTGGSWQSVGSADFSAGSATNVSLAFYGGEPYVAYKDGGNGWELTVMRCNAGTWELVGTAGFTSGGAATPSLAFNGSEPYLAFQDGGGGATVMRFTGGSWQLVGSAEFTAGNAPDTYLAFEGGEPYVSYRDFANGSKATVMRYTGGSWQLVGAAGFSPGVAMGGPSLAFAGGEPYVAFRDSENGTKATVMKFTGGSWQNVGAVGFSAGQAYPAIAMNGGQPVVAYADGGNADYATVMQFVPGFPQVTTTAISNITTTTADSGGNVTADGGASVTARGVCWSTSANPTTADSKTTDGTGTGSYTSNITGLTASTTYYVRAYATNSSGTGYGSEVSFASSGGSTAPTVTTTAISNITDTTADSGGNVTADGGEAVTARGVCWSTSANPTTADSKTTDGTGTGVFTSSITGLTPGTTYYVAAYATNSVATAYGADETFVADTTPTVTTTAISNIAATTADSGGNVTADGGDAVTVRGVCWSTSANPTTADSKTTDGTGTGAFTSSITGLTADTTYYVAAYATNSVGTSYGSDVSFTTDAAPTVTTTAISNITTTTADSGGNVTADGGDPVTARGVCWSTSANPTTADSKTTDGTGTGAFTSNITGLTAGTTYYVRAYATNSVGTSYGSEVSFTTSTTTPTVTTTAISNITPTTAASGGNVTADGGDAVTARGVCWSTSANPTTADSKTTDGTGTGAFTSSITGLTEGTTYYVRAYATNGVGTAYGSEVSFTTGTTPYVQMSGDIETFLNAITIPNSGTEAFTAPSGDIASWRSAIGQLVNGDFAACANLAHPLDYHLVEYSDTTSGNTYYILLERTSGGDPVRGLGTYVFYPNWRRGLNLQAPHRWHDYNTRPESVDMFLQLEAAVLQFAGTHRCANSACSPCSGSTSVCGGCGGSSYFESDVAHFVDTFFQAASSEVAEQIPSLVSVSIHGFTPCDPTTDTSFVIISNGTSGTAADSLATRLAAEYNILLPGVYAGELAASVNAVGGEPEVVWACSGSPPRGTTNTQGRAINASPDACNTSVSSAPLPERFIHLEQQRRLRDPPDSPQWAGVSWQITIDAFAQLFTTPTVTTTAISNITGITADSGGNVTADGGESVTARGVCWRTSANPTTADSKTTDGTGTGAFTSNITGLSSNTTYHVRAYATNSVGTAYGSDVECTTDTTPTVTTTAISNITGITADSGGNVTAGGGAAVTARGVCWSTSADPTTADSKTTDGTGTGVFTSNITGLTSSTTYYVAAYATNSVGTSYGSEVSFTTDATTPTVTTTAISNIAATTADSGGNVSADGGAAVTACGVCWGTAANPTTADSKTVDGTGTSAFTSNITDLTANTTYYVAAYATNAIGTSYGSDVTFTTSALVMAPDLSMAISSSAVEQLEVGDAVAFNITIDNAGEGGATDVVLTFPLPENTEFISARRIASGAAQAAPLSASVTDGNIVIQVGNVAAGEDVRIELLLRAMAAGTIELEGTASANEAAAVSTAEATSVAVGTTQEGDQNLLRLLLSLFFGAPICGLGAAVAVPLSLVGLVCMKRRQRRRRG